MKALIYILDKIDQYLCPHKKRWETSYEIGRRKSGSSSMTCSWEWNIDMEHHCNKCGKKWFTVIHK